MRGFIDPDTETDGLEDGDASFDDETEDEGES
jgi:hypothetical protein